MNAIPVVGPDETGVGDVGAAVVRALAVEPPAVVYDLTDLDGGPPPRPATFDTIDRYLRSWPATPLLVCTPEPEQRRALSTHPLGGRVTTWPTLDAALTAARRHQPVDRSWLDLDPVPTAPRQARGLVRRTLVGWSSVNLLDAASLVITELVNNALMHASTPMTASVSRPRASTTDAVRLAVRDGDRGLPVLSQSAQPMPGGRGIWLIDAVSRAWGVALLDGGKIVWSVLDGREAGQ